MNAIKILSKVIFFLFYNRKWRKKRRTAVKFRHDKAAAIAEADRLHAKNGKYAYVMQNGTNFMVSQRQQFRELNSKYRGRVKGSGLTFNYRKAIIYTAK